MAHCRYSILLLRICSCLVLLLAGQIKIACATPWAEGKKRVLYLRVDFPDQRGEPQTDVEAKDMLFNLNRFVVANSGGKTSLDYVVTPVVHLPESIDSYYKRGWVDVVRAAAEAEVKKQGIDPATFDLPFVICRNPRESGGIATIGGRGLMLHNGFGLGITAHEFAHNLGMPHAGFWVTDEGDVIGDGHREEYGIPFDPSSGGGVDDPEQLLTHQYNSYYKSVVGWLPAGAVRPAAASGVYTLSPHDLPVGTPGVTNPLALKIPIGNNMSYWVEMRRSLVKYPWVMDGVLIMRTWDNVTRCELLDMTPGSQDGAWDSSLLTGCTFSDPAAAVHITPLASPTSPKVLQVSGSMEPVRPEHVRTLVRVVVNRGKFEDNHKPLLSLRPQSLQGAEGKPLEIKAEATDADGDELTYSWTFGDGTYAGGAPEVIKTWDHTGEYVIECVASDMKGGIARASAVVRVTSSTLISRWRRISGRVTEAGQPLEGASVQIGPFGDVQTDSDGRYTIPGLGPGTYAVSVHKPGYAFAAQGFTNPVRLGSNLTGIDFIATRAAPRGSRRLRAGSYAEIVDSANPQPLVVVSPSAGELYMFARGRDLALWYRVRREGHWSEWQSLGGKLTSAPTAVSWGPGRMDVFARSDANTMIHKWWDGKVWSQWESMDLDGVEDSAITVASWSVGRLDIFARGLDNTLWHKWFAGGWSGWESLGGVLTGPPAAVSWGQGRIDIIAASTDNLAIHKYFGEGKWSDWESEALPEDALPYLSLCSSKPGRLDLVTWSKAGGVYHQSFEKLWSKWQAIGGQFSAPPVAYSAGPGMFQIVGPAKDEVTQRTFTGAWGEWETSP